MRTDQNGRPESKFTPRRFIATNARLLWNSNHIHSTTTVVHET